MKAATTFSIDFIIRRNKNDKDKGLLYARVTVNGKRTEISLKEEVMDTNWDSKQEMVKGKSQAAKATNNYIEDVRFRLKEKYRMLVDNQTPMSAESIKDAYLGNHRLQKSGDTLNEFLKYHAKIAI